MKNENKKGFTLLEMLVVVLIIGILAGIALPQYGKAVIKARLTEALVNIKNIENSIDMYLLKNGFQREEEVVGEDLLDIELSGGEWDDNKYYTNKHKYSMGCASACELLVSDKNDFYSSAALDVYWMPGDKSKGCFTNDTDIGRFICKYLEPLGWEYIDSSWE